MLTVATLGPSDSNHDFVTKKYLKTLDIKKSCIVLFEDFDSAVSLLKSGEVDCIIQCAAHPDVSKTIGANLGDIFVIDTFISESKPLAVVTQTGIKQPTSIGFHPATREYVNLNQWTEHYEEQSTVRVAEGLLSGKYHSGITALDIADNNPGEFRVDSVIGSAQDAWIVYSTRSVYSGNLITWRDGPGAYLLREIASTEKSD
ncbi:hypothetical protein OO007_16290 [Cocleimonas sp. KMM 6892]|uniref:hypothetical protein n=1 Tax=unclassified Cocleimonas TaxID=2639732 RepID=UPI002DB72554|nr:MULTISPECIES: hypothetical protein [unclassified Cocleimonas]MEB8433800.1 hypothetical protein [Cocleimonas sp. KMM 6892]MEC4716611.1 hypothetical protein [Cocleimonas sp. KMM 6895]MEC4746234.1 hypothetical protein [Cocleimonas sp. KMM 6896]